MEKNKNYLLAAILIIPAIIYVYFLRVKTFTVYGDDLYIYQYHSTLHSLTEQINMAVSQAKKYRPINGIIQHLCMVVFQKNTDLYYAFNIAIQALNTLIFARLAGLFIKSPWYAYGFALLFGLSRFAFYNMSQLYNGGALEGLAMTFFLLCVLYLLRAMQTNTGEKNVQQRLMLWSILFANCCMYTHERYIVLFPFIILMTIAFPTLRSLSPAQKIGLSTASVLSIGLNVAIKKYVFGVPFFVGTGGTDIQLSLDTAFNFFVDGVFSILQFNSKPEYLTGITYHSLPFYYQGIVLISFLCIAGIFCIYIARIARSWFVTVLSKIIDPSVIRITPDFTMFPIFFILCMLFVLSLVPSVVTIRLEQRWLQAGLSVFLLLLAATLSTIRFKNEGSKHLVYLTLIISFLWADFNYFRLGENAVFMSSAEQSATQFKTALNHNVIHRNTTTLYFVEKQKDVNGENALSWALGGYYMFEFYNSGKKNIIFVDSVYQRTHTAGDSTMGHFNKNTDQVICLRDSIVDITNDYLKDSLKNF